MKLGSVVISNFLPYTVERVHQGTLILRDVQTGEIVERLKVDCSKANWFCGRGG